MMCKCKECVYCKKIKCEYYCAVDGVYDTLKNEEAISFCAWFKPIKCENYEEDNE